MIMNKITVRYLGQEQKGVDKYLILYVQIQVQESFCQGFFCGFGMVN